MLRIMKIFGFSLGKQKNDNSKNSGKVERKYTEKFPKSMWDLDDSYKNMMRELSKR